MKFEGKRLDPIRLKGLLNRESRAKRRYDLARLRLLGLEEEDATFIDDAWAFFAGRTTAQ